MPNPPVPRSLLLEVAERLGYDPNTVTKITLEAEYVCVELTHPVAPGE